MGRDLSIWTPRVGGVFTPITRCTLLCRVWQCVMFTQLDVPTVSVKWVLFIWYHFYLHAACVRGYPRDYPLKRRSSSETDVPGPGKP